MSQVGNPDGEDKPNKKYFDPSMSLQTVRFCDAPTNKKCRSLGSRGREDNVCPCCRGS